MLSSDHITYTQHARAHDVGLNNSVKLSAHRPRQDMQPFLPAKFEDQDHIVTVFSVTSLS